MNLFGRHDYWLALVCRAVGTLGGMVSLLVIANCLLFLPDGPRSQQIRCDNNLKQIGLALKTWAIDNEDHFPFQHPRNRGGTKEFCAVGSDGFDTNAVLHFQVMSNELSTPRILVCPKEKHRKAALDFARLRPENVTYRIRTGTNIDDSHPDEVVVVCPVDGNTLRCDGSVTVVKGDPPPPFWTVAADCLGAHPRIHARLMRGFAGVIASVVLFWFGMRLKSGRQGGGKEAIVIIGLAVVLIGFLLATPPLSARQADWTGEPFSISISPDGRIGIPGSHPVLHTNDGSSWVESSNNWYPRLFNQDAIRLSIKTHPAVSRETNQSPARTNL